MLEFEKLCEERNKIMMCSLLGERADLSELRSICKKMNDECEENAVFKLDGTDQQLWDSVNTYYHELLKKS